MITPAPVIVIRESVNIAGPLSNSNVTGKPASEVACNTKALSPNVFSGTASKLICCAALATEIAISAVAEKYNEDPGCVALITIVPAPVKCNAESVSIPGPEIISRATGNPDVLTAPKSSKGSSPKVIGGTSLKEID